MDEGANLSTRTILSGFITATPVKGLNLTARTVSALFHIAEYFTATYPRTAKMLALSLGFEGLERYFGAKFEPFLAALIQKEYGLTPSLIFLRFLRHGVLGLILNVMCGEKLSDNLTEELRHLLPTPPTPNQAKKQN